MIYRLAILLERFILEHTRLENRYPPLFVVGVPRSGTTALLLHLFNRFQFSCFPNISRRYHQAPISAACWGRMVHRYNPTYGSDYGEVAGPMAPSDGWEIFFRWFPRYDLSQPVDKERLVQLKSMVRLLEKIYGAPFINKNNSNPVRISELAELFPDALFVHVERDLFETVASNVEAREKHGIPLNKWWSVAPPRYFDHRFETQLEQVVTMVWDVNRYIGECLEKVPPQKRIRISYADFCRQPDQLLDWVSVAYTRLGFNLKDRKGSEGLQREILYRQRDIPPDLKKEMERILDKLKKSEQSDAFVVRKR